MWIRLIAFFFCHLIVVQSFDFFNLFQKSQLPLLNDEPFLNHVIDTYEYDADLKNNAEVIEMWEELTSLYSKEELLEAVDKLRKKQSISSPLNKVKNFQNAKDWEYVESSKHSGYNLRMKEPTFPEFLQIDKVKQYAGYLDIDEEDKHFFYWFFESRNDPANDPIILWLNGGPGCSSMTGLFFELGPSSIGADLKPIYNNFSWNTNASVIFLDEPVNVGYSHSSKQIFSSQGAAVDVYAFLELFFQKFAHLKKNDFHIAGESYLGHYIPAISHEIVKHDDRSFNFKSVLIGNGITDSKTQMTAYRPMACGEGGYKPVITEAQCDSIKKVEPRCEALIGVCYKYQNPITCVASQFFCDGISEPFSETGLNPYDIRIPCGESSLCYDDLNYVEEFLNLPIVMYLLGAEVENFTSCQSNVGIGFALYGDLSRPHQQFVAEILELGIPVLIYAGDKDYICNWLGNHYWTELLEWEGMYGFQAATLQNWTTLDGEVAGEVKSFNNLTFLRVYDAGHMVPYNQPKNSLDMVNRWISGDYTYGH